MPTTGILSRMAPGDRTSDPEPIAIAGLCVATFTMAGAIANAFVNYRKLVREQAAREEDAAADFLGHCDALGAAGGRLLSVIRLVGDHGEAAFKMTHRLPHSSEPGEVQPPTLRAGATSLELAPEERTYWRELVAEAARGVASMNEAIEDYEETLSRMLASGRRLEQACGVRLESLIGNVVDRSTAFRKALDSYQNLRAGSPIGAAEIRFGRLRLAAAGMVEAANGFATLTATLIRAKQNRA